MAVTGFYKALPKLAIERGIDNFKVFVRESAVNLRALKFVCVEVAAQSLQAQSHYLAQDERRKQLESKRYQGESELDLFNPSSTISHGENVIHIGKRYAFVNESFLVHGASLDAIATVCGRSRSTVQRRLSILGRSGHTLQLGLLGHFFSGYAQYYGLTIQTHPIADVAEVFV